MPSYNIESTDRGLHIEIHTDKESQSAVVQALDECRTGRCSCPTSEYDKLAGVELNTSGDSIEISLEAKPGAPIEPDRIEQCVVYTIGQGTKTSA